MRATRFVPVLITACLVASTSCSDATAPTPTGSQAGPAPTLTTLSGVVHFGQTKSDGITLTLDDGQDVPLSGAGGNGLASVENAEVDVRGNWNADTFVVTDFLVRRVGGSEVMDGVVIAFYGQEIAGDSLGYGLSLTRGSIVPLMDPPAELIAQLGARVWIAESPEGQASAFGIISR